MSFQGINFANQRLVPSDDGRLYQAIFTDGALFGCAASYSGSSFTIQPGYLIAGGRLFEIDSAESLVVNGAISGFAQIVITIDLTKTATKEAFNQISFDTRYASSESGFATLIQDDINGAGSRYELQLAMMSLGTGGITGIVQDVPVAALKGGGASLNYKVVGNTSAPLDPKENTIWVNTSTAITSHVFAATEPESPVEGMVWFNTGTSCSAPINVLKKNILMLYPTGCQQFISGKWVSKEAKTYQNGKWVSWLTYAFKNGWISPFTGFNTGRKNHNDTPPYIEITYNSLGNLVLNRGSWDGNSWLYSKETINLTEASRLCCKTGDIGSGDAIYLGVATGTDANTAALIELTGSNNVFELDVSACSGNYYYGFYHRKSTEGNWSWTNRVIEEIYYW